MVQRLQLQRKLSFCKSGDCGKPTIQHSVFGHVSDMTKSVQVILGEWGKEALHFCSHQNVLVCWVGATILPGDSWNPISRKSEERDLLLTLFKSSVGSIKAVTLLQPIIDLSVAGRLNTADSSSWQLDSRTTPHRTAYNFPSAFIRFPHGWSIWQ